MLKQLFLSGLLVSSFAVFALGNSSSEVDKKVVHNRGLNSSIVGSRQGSNSVFGHPVASGEVGHDYYGGKSNPRTQKNLPNLGSSRSVSSGRAFGEPKVTGSKGEIYYTKEQRTHSSNKSIQGSNMGSNQVFGNPGDSK